MNPQTTSDALTAPLSDTEVSELDELLQALPDELDPLDVEMLDGFLTAILLQPDPVLPSAWQPFIFDAQGRETPLWDDVAKTQRAIDLIMRRHNELAAYIAAREPFDPVIFELEDDNGKPMAGQPAIAALEPWAEGFMNALAAFPALLEALQGDDESTVALTGILRHLPSNPDDASAESREFAQDKAALDRDMPLARPRRCDRRARHGRDGHRRHHAAAAPRVARDPQGGAQRPVPVRQRAQVQALPRRQRALVSSSDPPTQEPDARARIAASRSSRGIFPAAILGALPMKSGRGDAMTLFDPRGVPVSTRNADSLERHEDALAMMHRHRGNAPRRDRRRPRARSRFRGGALSARRPSGAGGRQAGRCAARRLTCCNQGAMAGSPTTASAATRQRPARGSRAISVAPPGCTASSSSTTRATSSRCS